jgi:peptidoglycan/LPS O-acetylase OafA/YrhL
MVASKSVLAKNFPYRPDIDGLRAISVLAVIAYHFGIFPEITKGGFLGVDIFFTISGFLITKLLLSDFRSSNWIRNFYFRRIRRIFPALILILFSTLILGSFLLLPFELRNVGTEIIGGSTFSSNLIYLHQSGYFDSSASYKPLLHLWSLGIEEQFYIFWPVFIWGMHRLRLNKRNSVFLFLIISFIYCLYVSRNNPIQAFYSPLSRSWELAAGGLLAISNLERFSSAKKYSGLTGLFLIGISLLVTDHSTNWPGYLTGIPILGTVLVLFDDSPSTLKNRVLSMRTLVFIGKISFPLYLWHWPILSLYVIVNGPAMQRQTKVILLLIIFSISILTYFAIERPIRRHSNFQLLVPVLSICMMSTLLFGSVLATSNGFPQRIANNVYPSSTYNPSSQFAPIDFQDKACITRFNNPNAKNYAWWFCRLSEDKSPTVLLWGNSFANQYFEGISSDFHFRSQTILSIGDCSVQRDRSLAKGNPCSGSGWDEQQNFIKGLVEGTKSVNYIIVAGLFQNPSQENLDDLRDTLNFLIASQVNVIVFYPHINPLKSISDCIDRPVIPASWNCQIPSSVREKLEIEFSGTLRLIEEEFPTVQVFDPNAVFCTDKNCNFISDGNPLLRDSAPHISTQGSILVASKFASWAKLKAPGLVSKP